MAEQHKRGGKKNRKFGRKSTPSGRGYAQNCAYKAEGRRTRNKACRMVRTFRRQPNNAMLWRSIEARSQDDPTFARHARSALGDLAGVYVL